jgi:HNH endonuclease
METNLTTHTPFDVDFLEACDPESIIVELKRVAAKLGRTTLSAMEIDMYARVKYNIVLKQFGGLRMALEAAGLKPSRCNKATDEELLKIMTELWTITLRESGRRPRTAEIAKYGFPVGQLTIIKRFGSWKKALIATSKAAAGQTVDVSKVVSSRRQIPLNLRFMVMKRDRYRCRICNRAGVELEVDHIVPVSQGGSDRMDNLQTACQDCNRGKGSQLQ